MHPLAFGSRISYPTSLTYPWPGPLRDRRQDKELSSSGTRVVRPGAGRWEGQPACTSVVQVCAASQPPAVLVPLGEWSRMRAVSPGSPSPLRGWERHEISAVTRQGEEFSR
jgi:hypothetical protein